MKTNSLKYAAPVYGRYYRDLAGKHGTPLLILDGQAVRQQFYSLSRALPGVELFYAIKSLPHPAIIRLLADLGAGFDLASSGEIRIVRALGVAPRRTIHTHPIKRDRDIRDALRFGCTTFVIDNSDELLKFLPYRNRVGLLVRVAFRSPTAVVDLSKKFGCSIPEASELIALAARLGIHVKGLSFHAGSQCGDAMQQVIAINACNTLIRQNHGTGSAPLSLLDIGGGFPVSYDHDASVNIDAFCAPIREALSKLPPHVSVIAEPGRFISAPAMTCITSVIGKTLRNGLPWYYLDDGLYGSFSGQLYDHMRYPLEVFSQPRKLRPSVLAGPTCDSIDVIAEEIPLPEMEIGDLVVGHMMGAYTSASATEFNSLEKAKILPVKMETQSVQGLVVREKGLSAKGQVLN